MVIPVEFLQIKTTSENWSWLKRVKTLLGTGNQSHVPRPSLFKKLNSTWEEPAARQQVASPDRIQQNYDDDDDELLWIIINGQLAPHPDH